MQLTILILQLDAKQSNKPTSWGAFSTRSENGGPPQLHFPGLRPHSCCFLCRVEPGNITTYDCFLVPCRTGRTRPFPGLFMELLTMTVWWTMQQDSLLQCGENRFFQQLPRPRPVFPISFLAVLGLRGNFCWLMTLKER